MRDKGLLGRSGQVDGYKADTKIMKGDEGHEEKKKFMNFL